MVCTGGEGGLVSLSVATGVPIWNVNRSQLGGGAGFPLLSVGGGAIASDGSALVGVDSSGLPFGPVSGARLQLGAPACACCLQLNS